MTKAAVKFEQSPLPPRLQDEDLVDTGSLEWLASAASRSPAHALQHRLLEAYVAQGNMAPAAAFDAQDERYSLPVRLAIIVGLATSAWLPFVGAGLVVRWMIDG